MRLGNKIICIKDVIYQTGLTSNTLEVGSITIKEGEIYKITFINDECLYFQYPIKWDYALFGEFYQDYIDVRIQLNNSNILWVTHFKDNFITLLEHRHNKIDRLLK